MLRRITSIETRVVAAEDDFSLILRKITSIETRVVATEDDFSLILRKITSIETRVMATEDDFSLIGPPHHLDDELLKLLGQVKAGSLRVICYGTNRYGGVLSGVMNRFSHIETHIVVCPPEDAITPSDTNSILDMIEELSSPSHITVTPGIVRPTIRAALLRHPDNIPIWVSVSPYLMHKRNRGMYGAGVCPIMKSDIPGSRPMKILSEFVDTEFDRQMGNGSTTPPTTISPTTGRV